MIKPKGNNLRNEIKQVFYDQRIEKDESTE